MRDRADAAVAACELAWAMGNSGKGREGLDLRRVCPSGTALGGGPAATAMAGGRTSHDALYSYRSCRVTVVGCRAGGGREAVYTYRHPCEARARGELRDGITSSRQRRVFSRRLSGRRARVWV